MARLRVFVSSTAYDLKIIRGQLRTLVEQLGHEPVLSDYADVLFDPSSHTHKSCVQELRLCDMVVLVVGSRFGSIAVPEFVAELDVARLDDADEVLGGLKDRPVSVTQLEALNAFEAGLPVFAFVEDAVMHDMKVYESNPDVDIHYPSVGDVKTAKYIFGFIEYIRARSSGNAIFTFDKTEEIETQLKAQWSALFQRLLTERRSASDEQKRAESITEQLEDLKTALLTSIQDTDARDVARGVVRFRLLNDVLRSIGAPAEVITGKNPPPWLELLRSTGVEGKAILAASVGERETRFSGAVLHMRDGSFVELRVSDDRFNSLQRDWSAFAALPSAARRVIVDALDESAGVRLGQARRFTLEESSSATRVLGVVPLDDFINVEYV